MYLSGLNLENFIEHLFASAQLDARSADIITKRFGLSSPETDTLQALGTQYDITRERVRQLEEQAILKIKKIVVDFEEALILKNFTEKHLSATGGLRRNDILMREIQSLTKSTNDAGVFSNQAGFIFQAIGRPFFCKENNTFYGFWYVNDEAKKEMEIIHNEITHNLKKVEQFDEILRSVTALRDMQETIAISLLAVSKRLGVGPYGDFGLTEWDEVNPKTVRAKAFAFLKKENNPQHFMEIAKKIGSHAPTVHNELIKDPRFVLVSRGTYGLKL